MRTKRMHLFIAILLLGSVVGFGSGTVWAQAIETPTETPVETPTLVPTATPLLPTATPVETSVETPTETPTNTPVPTATSVPPTPTQSETSPETPTATPVPPSPTPVETNVETPTATPMPPTATPVPPSPTPVETGVETPTATPVPPSPTPTETAETPTETPVPPTATPVPPSPTPVETGPETPTATPVPQKVGLTLMAPAAVNVGDAVTLTLQVSQAVGVDAFGFDVLQSSSVLQFVSVSKESALTSEFLQVSGRALTDPSGAVRVAAVGGPSSVTGDGVLLTIQYTAIAAGETTLSLANIVDDLQGADVDAAVVVVSETSVETPTPTETGTVTPTPTPVSGTPTPTPVVVPTPTPTVIEVNPELGLVSLDELGGTYPRGNAVHNFDIGTSNSDGQLVKLGTFDGNVDPDALGPFLFIDGQPIPIAKDMEFTGEIASGGNGSEGAYFLIGGSIGSIPPVSGRLGATGGPLNGGIDINNDGKTINFGTFKSDIVPVLFMPTDKNPNGEFVSSLVDLEPAGNGGFYVLAQNGKIYAEGNALESIDTSTPVTLSPNSIAVGLKIWRGKTIDTNNSQYSTDLIGTGAYVLDSAGAIQVVGNAPALDTSDLPVVPMDQATGVVQDIEFIPNKEGTEWIGVGVLMGDGLIAFAPFADVQMTDEIREHVKNISPFGNFEEGFPINIARDFEIEISDSPIYGVDANGNTVATHTGRRVGIFEFDGFGGVHTGGASTRFAPAFLPTGIVIPGQQYNIGGSAAVAFPVNPPYTFNLDVTNDVELAWPVKR